MGTELAERPTLSAQEVKAGLDLILQVMKNTMEKGKDYGLIPGCGDKPTLFKPGSEKILTAFRIGVDPEVEDLSTGDEARYRVKTRLFHEPTGIELGKGIGEASSYEEKYKWRKIVCEEEFQESPEDRRRIVWKRGDKPYQVKQVRTNKADVANTVLKMAKKRSQIDGTLTTTAASAVFNQDLEDMEAEVRESVVEGEAVEKSDPQDPPKRASETKSDPGAQKALDAAADWSRETFIPAAVSVKSGEKNGKSWKKYGIKSPADAWYGTFDANLGELALLAKEEKFAIKVAYKHDGQYLTATEIERA